MKPLADQRERRRIREELDRTFMVEAAAGTGKTTELVGRMISVLAGGRADVGAIVAVTFTEKAAGELKLRLRAEIERERQKAPDGSARRANLEQALARLEEARVGTIHGFCADLLRERSVEARVDPAFAILPEPEAGRLFREAFQFWLQEKLEDPPEGVRRALRRVARAGRGPAGAAEGPVDRLLGAGRTLVEWRDFGAPWRREPFDRSARIAAVVEVVLRFAEMMESCAHKDRDRLYQATAPVRHLAGRLRAERDVEALDEDGMEAALVDLLAERDFVNPGKGGSSLFAPRIPRQDVLAVHGEVVTTLREFQAEADADLAACLQGELREAIARYETRKARTGKLDFVDLLVRTRDLLRDAPEVRAEYQERFSHLFVDEFQDTDPLQAEILLLLAADDPAAREPQASSPVPGKLFLVGDPKQSIYRFRRADVGTYLSVKRLLLERGAECLQLTTSFRSVPEIQRVVNAAFAPLMQSDEEAHASDYVPLGPSREPWPYQPAVVALPVPDPLGARGRPTKGAIERSLPDATGAFVRWLLSESGWTVTTRERPGERVPVEGRHVCILLRRFSGFWAGDVTRGYVEALEARGIRHLLVGGRSFHERDEVETLRTALAAVEWPDDELSLFATLRGPLFAIGDEELLRYRHELGRLHPYRPRGEDVPAHRAIVEALALLRDLHGKRNARPVAETIALLLESTRAHTGFVLRPSGEQVLANVLHLADEARRYESEGGISFRGFVERLLEDAEGQQAAEAPILEEGSDGVRIMTVHKAKGLEFPVVILADPTASLVNRSPGRWIDAERDLCAVRIGGWSPWELEENRELELRRETAEGIRLAYVAATRARDLLVVPVLGEGAAFLGDARGAPTEGGWLSPLSDAVYPPPQLWQAPEDAPACPPFGPSSVRSDDGESGEGHRTVHPGGHRFEAEKGYDVVWWDPNLLEVAGPPRGGIRREELITKDADPELVRADIRRFTRWRDDKARAIEKAGAPSAPVRRATEIARTLAAEEPRPPEAEPPIEVVELAAAGIASRAARPAGAVFGALMHAILATVPLAAPVPDSVARTARLQARILGAGPGEEEAAVVLARQVLEHALLRRAARAAARGACRRETPLTWRAGDGTLIEGIVDLAFEEDGRWWVLDFKTDRELALELPAYRRQLGVYTAAVAAATGKPANAVLFWV